MATIKHIEMMMKLDGQTDGRRLSVEACIRPWAPIPGLERPPGLPGPDGDLGPVSQ